MAGLWRTSDTDYTTAVNRHSSTHCVSVSTVQQLSNCKHVVLQCPQSFHLSLFVLDVQSYEYLALVFIQLINAVACHLCYSGNIHRTLERCSVIYYYKFGWCNLHQTANYRLI